MKRIVAVALVVTAALTAHSQTHPAAKAKSPFSRAVDQTLEQGHDALLPPHISHLLGISPDEHEVAVKQFVVMEQPIRGFEVSTADHHNVVLFVENRDQKESTFYLTSSRGLLRRVLSVRQGVGYGRVPTKGDRAAFEKERQLWLDRLSPHHP